MDKNLGGADFDSFNRRTNDFSDNSRMTKRNTNTNKKNDFMEAERPNYDLNDIDENEGHYYNKKRE